MYHFIVWAGSPALGLRHMLGLGAQCGEGVRTGAAVFEQGWFGGTVAPAKQTALVDWMQRVNKHESARKRNPGRDTPLTEHSNNVGVRSAGQTCLGQPSGQICEEGFIHAAIIQKVAVRTRVNIAEPPINVRIRVRTDVITKLRQSENMTG